MALSLLGAVACVAAAQRSTSVDALADARVDRLVVDKSDERMWAYSGDTLVAEFQVAVGAGGLGEKRWEGDRRTPEGEYRIDERHRSESFHRFLHVSYPNAEDRARYQQLVREERVPLGARGRPVGIGSAVGIHGTGDGFFSRLFGQQLGATLGCIMVSNQEAEALYRAVVPGARITIRP